MTSVYPVIERNTFTTMIPTTFTETPAVLKIKQYCAYQERCIAEVREKLHSLDWPKKETGEIIDRLIAEGYINEERFAMQFARGRFNLKHWGKIKIKHALKQKKVSEYAIQKALGQIDENDYRRVLNKLAQHKVKILKSGKNNFSRKKMLYDYLLQKGYEPSLVKEVAKRLVGVP